MDPKVIKAHNVIQGILDFYAQALAEAAQREQALREELKAKDDEIERLRKQ